MSTYCCSDIHGVYKLYEKIKDFIGPEDKVYFLGDAVDRGPEPWKCFKSIYYDPQFIFLKGNHEDMLAKSIDDYSKYGYFCGDNFYLHVRNGGKSTCEQWEADGANLTWCRKIMGLQKTVTYYRKDGKIVVMSHAGFTPGAKFCDFIWDRQHINDAFDIKEFPDVYVIHGHTPWCYIAGVDDETEPYIYSYASGHKIDVDCGSFWTNTIALLDLDTFEPIYFKV